MLERSRRVHRRSRRDGFSTVPARARRGSVVVTTYGTSDADFTRLRDRWSRWWTDTYEVIEIQP
jgi:hypothetical protein